jgi:hypothetical protein
MTLDPVGRCPIHRACLLQVPHPSHSFIVRWVGTTNPARAINKPVPHPSRRFILRWVGMNLQNKARTFSTVQPAFPTAAPSRTLR